MSIKENNESIFEGDPGVDDDVEDLVDAEELTNKKKLRDKSIHEKPVSRLSQAIVEAEGESVSEDSMNPEEGNEKLNLTDKDILLDRKRADILKSNSSKRHSIDIDFTNENLNLKSIKSNKNNNFFYPISAERFSHFETLLFELVGFTNSAYKVADETKKSTEVDYYDEAFNSKFIPNMETLCQKLEINTANQVQIKKPIQIRSSMTNSRIENDIDSLDEDVRMKNINSRAKLVTIVLNQSIRPRKAGRILLNRRNTASLDSIFNEICNFFKVDVIKRIHNLNGVQILDPLDLYYQDDIFLAFTNDKVHNKDFELDIEEIKLYYASEFMSANSDLSPSKIQERNAKTSSAYSLKKSKQTENLIENSQADMELMPEDLLDNYEIGQVIGEGHYAIVRECKDINTGIQFALKIIDLKKCGGKESMIENELSILRKVKHPNIVKLVEEYRSKHFVYLIFEYYKAGDLLESVRTRLKFLEKDAAAMIYSLASALTYLHSMNIVHRDVKLDNILIQQYPDGSKSLKLGDFGLATIVNGPLNQKCGSPVYVAPEVLLGKEYGLEVDVWSLGIIAYIILCGYAPFQGQNEEETLNVIKHSELKFNPKDWEKISPLVVDLITKMLDRNQETRIKASEILSHPWFIQQSEANKSVEIQSEMENSSFLSEIDALNKTRTTIRGKTADTRIVLPQIKKTKTYKPPALALAHSERRSSTKSISKPDLTPKKK